MIDWLDDLVVFPSDFEFIKFIVIGVIVVIGVCLAFSFIVSTISAIFNRR